LLTLTSKQENYRSIQIHLYWTEFFILFRV